MPKNQYTPREELVCGKLDALIDLIPPQGITADVFDMIQSIRHDCERMEAKLASRKREMEQAADLIELIGTHECGCDVSDVYRAWKFRHLRYIKRE